MTKRKGKDIPSLTFFDDIMIDTEENNFVLQVGVLEERQARV